MLVKWKRTHILKLRSQGYLQVTIAALMGLESSDIREVVRRDKLDREKEIVRERFGNVPATAVSGRVCGNPPV